MKKATLLCLFLFCVNFAFAQDTLYVFVGEKIDLVNKPYKDRDTLEDGRIVIPMDAGFIATYKVIQNVYGDYPKDTIIFDAYDHYGIPPFSKHQNVLLFVSVKNGRFYHQKYQYFAVYKTIDNRWASPYSIQDYTYNKERNIDIKNIKPHRIELQQEVYYNTTHFKNGKIRYPKRKFDYRCRLKKSKVIYGNYLDELFELKKGIFRARGLVLE